MILCPCCSCTWWAILPRQKCRCRKLVQVQPRRYERERSSQWNDCTFVCASVSSVLISCDVGWRLETRHGIHRTCLHILWRTCGIHDDAPRRSVAAARNDDNDDNSMKRVRLLLVLSYSNATLESWIIRQFHFSQDNSFSLTTLNRQKWLYWSPRRLGNVKCWLATLILFSANPWPILTVHFVRLDPTHDVPFAT